MKSDATSVREYLDSLPDDRREAIAALRKTVRANLDKRVVEGIQYGMIGYSIPHSVYPPGYHCDPKQPLPFLSMASQKNHMALYLFCLYTDPKEVARFEKAWKKTGKRLDMGKSCVRFRKIEDVPLEVIADTVKRMTVDAFIRSYESAYGAKREPASGGKASSGKTPPRKAKKTATPKKAAARR